jgi:hypothetical protein
MYTPSRPDWTNKRTRIIWSCLALLYGVVQWPYLGLEFSRHWSAMSPYSHMYAILYFLGCPLPGLYLFRREPHPLYFVVVTYGLLLAGTMLIFPIPY